MGFSPRVHRRSLQAFLRRTGSFTLPLSSSPSITCQQVAIMSSQSARVTRVSLTLLLLLCLSGCRSQAGEASDDTCAAGQAAARKCQVKMQAYIKSLIEDQRVELQQGINRLCCALAHGYDCMMRTAIPRCTSPDERHELRVAMNTFFTETPKNMFQRSCDSYKYSKERVMPTVCKGLVDPPIMADGLPWPAGETDEDEVDSGKTPVLTIVIPIIVVLAVAILAGLAYALIRRRRAAADSIREESVTYRTNGNQVIRNSHHRA